MKSFVLSFLLIIYFIMFSTSCTKLPTDKVSTVKIGTLRIKPEVRAYVLTVYTCINMQNANHSF